MSTFLFGFPQGFQGRPAELRDAQAVTDLFNLCCREFSEPEAFSRGETLSDWSTPGFALEDQSFVLLDSSGALQGYACWWKSRKADNHYSSWIRTMPGPRARELFLWLLSWLQEGLAQQIGMKSGVLEVIQSEEDHSGNGLLRAAGFGPARYSWRMERELPALLPEPVWPREVHLRRHRQGDAQRVYQLAERVFQGQWQQLSTSFEERFQRWLHEQKGADGFDFGLWFLVTHQNREVAFLIGCQSVADDPEMGWIDLLGVDPAWRRQGLARSLLSNAFQVFKGLGRERVGLSVTTSNPTGALSLYQSVGLEKRLGWVVFQKALDA